MNIYLIGTILNISSILMIAACGSWIAIRGGNFNLGGEGQIYAGGFTAAIFLSHFSSMPPLLALSFGFLISGAVSAVLALFSALLKQYRNTDVLLSSFLVSAAVIPIIDSLIANQARGKTNNLLATAFIPQNFRLTVILPPSPLNTSIFAAIIFCIILWIFINRANFGKELTIYGISPEFALYSGFSEEKLNFISIGLSGFLHGLAGFFAVAGTYFTCHSGFYTGLGWNALSASLLASKNPLFIIPCSIILAAITTGASQFSLLHNFSFDMGGFLQGFLMLIVVMILAISETSSKKSSSPRNGGAK